MMWTKDELREVKIRKIKYSRGKRALKQANYTEYYIPTPYDRLVSQLVLEAVHGENHDSHESRRRETYAREVLDEFAKELERLKDRSKGVMTLFRSAVLTPILQRQRRGVHDAYTPAVRVAIRSDLYATPGSGTTKGSLTVEDVTKFYLWQDPTEPVFISSYRHSVRYLPEVRWHLAHTLGRLVDASEEESIEFYNSIREHHDQIMEGLKAGYSGHFLNGIPLLTNAEISAIITEGIELFFEEEFTVQVSCLSSTLILTFASHCRL